MRKFWKNLQGELETKLNFSSAYHPQRGGYIKMINHNLENILQSLVGNNLK